MSPIQYLLQFGIESICPMTGVVRKVTIQWVLSDHEQWRHHSHYLSSDDMFSWQNQYLNGMACSKVVMPNRLLIVWLAPYIPSKQTLAQSLGSLRANYIQLLVNEQTCKVVLSHQCLPLAIVHQYICRVQLHILYQCQYTLCRHTRNGVCRSVVMSMVTFA